MKAALSALAAGLLFGAGLSVSGMTDPKNILAFLDVTGHWSPNLLGVMVSAIAVHASWLHFSARKPSPLSGSSLAPRARIDGALVGGAALFGVGWGLAGYCPGPVIVSLGKGALGPVVFVAAMVLGMRLIDALRGPTKEALPDAERQPHAAE